MYKSVQFTGTVWKSHQYWNNEKNNRKVIKNVKVQRAFYSVYIILYYIYDDKKELKRRKEKLATAATTEDISSGS